MKKVLVLLGLVGLLTALVWRTEYFSTEKPRQGLDAPPYARHQTVSETNAFDPNLLKFASEVRPDLEEFLRRIQGVNGVLLPFDPMQVEARLSSLRFSGGSSNMLCAFVVSQQNAFGYHRVRRNNREYRGFHSFNRTGKDSHGMPLNLDQLKARPIENEPHFQTLMDTRRYPLIPISEVAATAQKTLAALVSTEIVNYSLQDSWQEQIGTNLLPFYAFIFPKKSNSTTDPSSLMRDEIVMIFRSTSEGLLLDYFSDTSIAFIGSSKNIP